MVTARHTHRGRKVKVSAHKLPVIRCVRLSAEGPPSELLNNMESRGEEAEEKPATLLAQSTPDTTTSTTVSTITDAASTDTDTTTTGTAASSTSPTRRTSEEVTGTDSSDTKSLADEEEAAEEEEEEAAGNKEAPPTSLRLSQPTKKKVLVAPALSLSLGRSESTVSGDFPSTFLSPPAEDGDDMWLDLNLDGMETPSDSGSLPFPIYDPQDDMRRLGVASQRRRLSWGRGPRCGSRLSNQSEPGDLEREDEVDEGGTRWRCFSVGDPPQESRVNMSVLEPFLRVLSHGEPSGELPECDGPLVQVRGGDPGPDGGRELRDGVPVCWRSEGQAAGNQLAEGRIHHHQQEVEEEPEGFLCGSSNLVHQSTHHHHQTVHQL
uniref:suppressor protein SRP40-like isoform X7 n=1 Tax=Gasterosteus aculeatus aculeatus TaxID=481459 RepID=UPI001A97E1AC|nr:suppressor protein SRP40-like isoform X7 [Gasterosteus aculeatus aculeatus]